MLKLDLEILGYNLSMPVDEKGQVIRIGPGDGEQDYNLTETHKGLSKSIPVICEKLNFKPKVVYFPGSDISKLDNIFPEGTKVIYMDDNKKAIEELQNIGELAVFGDPEIDKPSIVDQVDLLVLTNYVANKPLNLVRPGGLLFTTDGDGAFNVLSNHPGFVLHGIVKNMGGSIDLDTSTEVVEKVRRDLTTDEKELTKQRQELRLKLPTNEVNTGEMKDKTGSLRNSFVKDELREGTIGYLFLRKDTDMTEVI